MGEIFTVETRRAEQTIDITDSVRKVVASTGAPSGVAHVMVLHSTAAVVVNETHDPNIGIDVLAALDRAVPNRGGWLHDRIDDNAHSHIKAAILGPSEGVPVSRGELVLGTWQRIMLIELDGPRTRRVSVELLAAPS